MTIIIFHQHSESIFTNEKLASNWKIYVTLSSIILILQIPNRLLRCYSSVGDYFLIVSSHLINIILISFILSLLSYFAASIPSTFAVISSSPSFSTPTISNNENVSIKMIAFID